MIALSLVGYNVLGWLLHLKPLRRLADIVLVALTSRFTCPTLGIGPLAGIQAGQVSPRLANLALRRWCNYQKHMSTRANIELHDGWEEDRKQGKMTWWRKTAVLYHHCDGYPSYMGPELERILQAAKQALDRSNSPNWWDGERVGALMITLSVDGELYESVPRFKPCLNLHGDIDYLWRVFLGPKVGAYEIQCFRVDHDWNKDVIKHLEPVDWRKEIERQRER
jgi:hypothetical protein